MDEARESEGETRLGAWVAAWMAAAVRRARLVVVGSLALAVLAGVYAAGNLGVNANLSALISEDLPYTQRRLDFEASLPLATDPLLLVVDGATPERAAEAAEELARRLEPHTDEFLGVFMPGGGAFFERNGLLYLDTAELEDLATSLAEAQAYLAEVGRDPSPRGVFRLLELAVRAIRRGEIQGRDPAPLLAQMSSALEALEAGRGSSVPWGQRVLGESAFSELRRRVVIVTPVLDFDDLQPARAAVARVREVVDATPLDDVRVRLTGDFALSFEEMQVVKDQAASAGVASFLLVALLLTLALRSAWLIGATLVTLLVGLVVSLGFAAAAVGHLNPISVAFAVLFIGLSVDFGIHLCLRYRELRGGGDTAALALSRTAHGVGSSIVLCAFTTAIGFYAFVPTDFRGVAELGLIAGTGMFVSLGFSLTLLPVLISLAPRRVQAGWSRAAAARAVSESRLARRSSGAVLVVTGVLAVGALVLMPRARFDHNPLNARDPNTESVQAFEDLLAMAGTSPWTISILADDMETAAATARRLEELEVVERALAPTDLVPADQRAKLEILGDIALFLGPPPLPADTPPPSELEQIAGLDSLRAELARFPERPAQPELAEPVARLAAVVEALAARLEAPEGRAGELARLQMELVDPIVWRLRRLHRALDAEPIGFDDLPATLVGHILTDDGRARIQVFPREDLNRNEALVRFVDGVVAVEPGSVGTALDLLVSARVVVRSFQQALLGAAVAVAVLLLVLWRRVGDTAVVLTTLGLAGLFTTAAAILVGIPFNFADVIVLPLLLGIGVDSSIHLVHRYRSERSIRGDLLRTSTARAVFFSALTTIASFGSLGFASHRGMASMGQLLTLGVALTLACTLVVLPALLTRRRGRSGRPPR